MPSPGTPPAPAGSKKTRSRKRWFFIWTLLGVLSGVAVFLFEPRVYRASTTIVITPQRVPEDMVKPTVTATLSERLNIMAQVILSRTRLERIIQEFNLYQRERQTTVNEDVIEGMREAISFNAPRRMDDTKNTGPESFSVAFETTDPRTAMRVTERLASLFVQENLGDRELLTIRPINS